MASNDNSVYCSTSGTFFSDKDTLTEHYKSDFHRYNLKRKVAGLPPVTKEWFEARKEQLLATAAGASKACIWVDPLTKKKFQSKQTYDTFVESRKYKELVRKSGNEAPAVKIIQKKLTGGESSIQKGDGEKEAQSSDWETDSEGSATDRKSHGIMKAEDTSEEWNMCRCFFDNHISDSFEANLEYMFKNFGFFLPNAEQLNDPQGLVKYLGAKLLHGHIPLYKSGLDPDAKRFSSLHGVQRHMIDSNKWIMLFEGNEEEYEDYYDFSWSDDDAGQELAAADEISTAQGYELVLKDHESGREKVLGTREFSRYYKQRYKPQESRNSVLAGQVVARYRNLGITTTPQIPTEVQRARKAARRRSDAMRLKAELRNNVNNNLPRNVPY